MKRALFSMLAVLVMAAFLMAGCVAQMEVAKGQAKQPPSKTKPVQAPKPKPFKPPAPKPLELGLSGRYDIVKHKGDAVVAIVVDDVEANTAIFYAGLKKGDEILSVGDNTTFASRKAFEEAWESNKKGIETKEGMEMLVKRIGKESPEIYNVRVSTVPPEHELLGIKGVAQNTEIVNPKSNTTYPVFGLYVTSVPGKGESILEFSEPILVGDMIYAAAGLSGRSFFDLDSYVKANENRLDTDEGLQIRLSRTGPNGKYYVDVKVYRAKVKK